MPEYNGSSPPYDPDKHAVRGFDYGPAMRELTHMQREFVHLMLDTGGRNATDCASKAGYSGKSVASLRAYAYTLSHNERVLAAMHEEAAKRMRSMGLMAVSNLIAIADDNATTNKDRLKANLAILDRVGLHAVTEHKVVKEDRTDQALVNRLQSLAKALKFGPEQVKALLGSAGVVVDGDFKVLNEVPEREQLTQRRITPPDNESVRVQDLEPLPPSHDLFEKTLEDWEAL